MKKAFPRLYAKASTGKVKVWRIWAEEGPGGARVVTEYGYDEGKLQRTAVEIEEGKNIGRSNQTTPFEQACLEAESKWNKKKDKKYTEDPSGKSNILLPMLALDYKKRKHHIKWPAYVQPKLNGIRCLALREGKKITYTSRMGKRFETLEHLTPHLLSMMQEGEVFDGEIFTPELTFQQICSAVTREKTYNPNSAKLQYWVYDLVLPYTPFVKRTEMLGEIVVPDLPVIFVDTSFVLCEKDMLKAHRKFIHNGYEGTIIRNLDGIYKQDFRSADLQKYKDFVDEEFKIIGGKEGVGKDVGAVTFICTTEEGKEFDCRPRGTYEQRRLWYQNLSNLIGKKLTVRYQNRTDDNKPYLPVGLVIRDYE